MKDKKINITISIDEELYNWAIENKLNISDETTNFIIFLKGIQESVKIFQEQFKKTQEVK